MKFYKSLELIRIYAKLKKENNNNKKKKKKKKKTCINSIQVCL